MHPKRGKLLDWFFPADLESVGGAILTELCRTDDKCSASSMKTSTDPLHAFGQACRQVSAVIGHPVVDHVIGMRGFPIVRPFVRNELNVRETIAPLQLGADGPESLCLLLRKGRIPDQHGILSRPIKRDTGRNDGIAIVDEHVPRSRKKHTDYPVPLAKN